MKEVIIALLTIAFSAALILYYFFYLKPVQNEKNRIKQEAKERAEVEELFAGTSAGFAQRSCEERCYKDFNTTELMAERL